MEKDKNYSIINKLCEMPSCTFKAKTPDGELRITVTQRGTTRKDPNEYDVKSYVEIRRENNSIFSKIDYRNWASDSLNFGGYHCDETIKYGPDTNHPKGYVLTVSHGYNNSISYCTDKTRYMIIDNEIEVNGRSYNVKNNILLNRIDNKFTVGINLQTGEEIVYVYEGDEKEIAIPLGNEVSFVDVLDKHDNLFETSVNQIAKQLMEKYNPEAIKQLLKISSPLTQITISNKERFRAKEQLTRLIANIYQINYPLLNKYHNRETMSAIEEAADNYMIDQEAEAIEREIERLKARQKQIGKRP